MTLWMSEFARFKARFASFGEARMGMMMPFIGLVLVALASGAVVLFTLVSKIDERANLHMQQVLIGALNSEVRTISDAAYSTARRRDAVNNLYGDLNGDWALTNLSDSIYSYVIDAQGRTLWAMGPDGRVPQPLWKASPIAARHLLRVLPTKLADVKKLKSGTGLFATFESKPAVAGAMPIIPLQGTRPLPGRELRYLVFVREMDGHVLDKWKDIFHFPRLAWQQLPKNDHLPNSLQVFDDAGNYLGAVIWPEFKTGTTAIRNLLPLMVVCLIVFAALSAWLILLIHRSRTALEANGRMARLAAAEATHNAVQADEARAEAEAALAQMDEARRRADEMARREVAEQALHQQQLRENSGKIAASLQESMSSLVKQLLETAADLELSAEMTMSTIHEQQKHADIVRRQSHESAAAIQAISGGIDELTASIGEIRRAADDSRESALTASDRSAAARSANGHLLAQVNSISDAASLISAIARQTNLLALNATIEASRAGESGYGFAVVANEVKALATQTAQLTSSIHERVGGIETAARSSVDLVGSVDGILEALVGSMASSSATVQQQQAVAQDIQRNSRDVADTASAADRAIEAISRSLDSVAQTANSTRQIGAAVRHRAEHLNAEFARLVAQLEAA